MAKKRVRMAAVMGDAPPLRDEDEGIVGFMDDHKPGRFAFLTRFFNKHLNPDTALIHDGDSPAITIDWEAAMAESEPLEKSRLLVTQEIATALKYGAQK